MTARVVKKVNGFSLVAGLSWVPLIKESPRALASEIRKVAGEADARKILLVKRNNLVSLGLYSHDASGAYEDLDEEADKGLFTASRQHSLAAVFAKHSGDGNAILAYTIGNGTLAVVVVVESGIPTIDEVKGIDEAQTITLQYASGNQGFGYGVYTNDPGIFGGAGDTTTITDETLVEHVDKSTRLVGKPVNLLAVVAMVLGLGLLVAAYFGYVDYDAKRVRQLAIKQAAAADPMPRYEAGLVAALQTIGPSKGEIQRLLSVIGEYPVSQAGWLLASVFCSSGSSICVSSWGRESGTTRDLTDARAEFKERLELEDALSRLRLARAVEIKLASMPASSVPSGSEQDIVMDSLLQRWSNAGLEISYTRSNAMHWPPVQGVDLKSLRPGVVVQRTPLQVVTPLYLAHEVVSQTPPNVWWTDLEASVEVSKGDVLVKLRGYVYGKAS
jgi:hypothetical protein